MDVCLDGFTKDFGYLAFRTWLTFVDTVVRWCIWTLEPHLTGPKKLHGRIGMEAGNDMEMVQLPNFRTTFGKPACLIAFSFYLKQRF